MKHLILCLIIILTTKLVFGQNLNFPDSNAIWSVYKEKYFVDGDSTYNAIDYKKYYFSNDSIVATGSFFALLREDTILKKVFSIAAGNSLEHLLYDFSLSINDTVTVYPVSFPFYSGPILIKVVFIDSILVGNNYHKRLKVSGVNQSTGFDEYWIEGIGSTRGVFNAGITGYIVSDVYYPILICYDKGGVNLYSNPNFASCYEDYPVGIKENILNFKTLLFPNPATSMIFIQSENEIKSYKIESLLGQLIKQQKLNAKSFSIDISNLVDGIYLVNLTTENGTEVKKLVKHGL